jgi:hypothetical protein
MTVLLWILGILALPLVAFGVWWVAVFVKEFIKADPEAEEEAEKKEEAVRVLGLLPASAQNTSMARPVPAEWSAAQAAARRGEWQPAAALLRSIGEDWNLRSGFVGVIGDVAVDDDTWLLAWENALPDDPDAAVVRAWSTVGLAGKVRGAKRAQHTSQEQFAGFHRTLARAREEIARAVELNPADPTPLVSEISVALGLGYPNSEMNKLWEQIVLRAPHHYDAHYWALQYWCAKWRGSKELAMDFAERAARSAPLGSLLTVLPLVAHFEHDDSDSADVDRTPRMIARVDAALADAAAADPAHPRLPAVRHVLAYFLALQDRHEAAIEQFTMVDGHIGALPWSYKGDPAHYYCHLRDISAAAVVAARNGSAA